MIEPSREAELIGAFANTLDLEDRTDDLATAAGAADWLLDRELVSRVVKVSVADHRKLLDLRTGVRSALGTDGSHQFAVGEAVLAELPVLVSLTDRVLVPSPSLSVVPRAMALLAISWSAVVLTGESQRLKRCANDTCQWVFWDISRNHSRRWCTMRVCGNRAKARSYSARQRTAATQI